METNQIKPESFNQNDLNQIEKLTRDINELRDFIEKLKAHKDDKIKALKWCQKNLVNNIEL